MTKERFLSGSLATLALLGGGAAASYTQLASADTTTTQTTPSAQQRPWGKMGHPPGKRGLMGHGVHGTVTAVNGTTVTVSGPDGKSYTIDASSSKVTRIVTGSLSDVQVGDSIGVRGTVTGTTVVAQDIMDDLPAPPEKLK